MHMHSDDRSVADLIKELAVESRTLLRQEIALARTEMVEKAARHRGGLLTTVAGGVLLIAALAMLFAALNRALTVLLAQAMPIDIAVWLAPFLLAMLLGAAGAGLVRSGLERVRREGVKPEKTVDSLKEDREWIEAQMS